MKKSEFFLNLLFPPSCIACHISLDPRQSDPLCPHCRSRFAAEKNFPCPTCQKPHSLCSCLPKRLCRSVAGAFHVGEYGSEKESVIRRMLLAAKEENTAALHGFMAAELAALCNGRQELSSLAGAVVTYVPRARGKVAEYGVDQAKETARRLAKALGLSLVPALIHQKNLAQKKLSAGERQQNAAAGYRLHRKAEERLSGRTVLLYDDILTTGATMAACAALLKEAGAKEIFCLSFGKTYLKQEISSTKREKGAAVPKKAGATPTKPTDPTKGDLV